MIRKAVYDILSENKRLLISIISFYTDIYMYEYIEFLNLPILIFMRGYNILCHLLGFPFSHTIALLRFTHVCYQSDKTT